MTHEPPLPAEAPDTDETARARRSLRDVPLLSLLPTLITLAASCAGLSALRCALLYPLDDPNPEHLMANRRFFEAQMDRFLRPEARLPQIQTQEYR